MIVSEAFTDAQSRMHVFGGVPLQLRCSVSEREKEIVLVLTKCIVHLHTKFQTLNWCSCHPIQSPSLNFGLRDHKNWQIQYYSKVRNLFIKERESLRASEVMKKSSSHDHVFTEAWNKTSFETRCIENLVSKRCQ